MHMHTKNSPFAYSPDICFLQAFAQLLQAPQDDAKLIIHDRFPVPRLVVCDQHGSQVSTFSFFFSFELSLILVKQYFPFVFSNSSYCFLPYFETFQSTD